MSWIIPVQVWKLTLITVRVGRNHALSNMENLVWVCTGQPDHFLLPSPFSHCHFRIVFRGLARHFSPNYLDVYYNCWWPWSVLIVFIFQSCHPLHLPNMSWKGEYYLLYFTHGRLAIVNSLCLIFLFLWLCYQPVSYIISLLALSHLL